MPLASCLLQPADPLLPPAITYTQIHTHTHTHTPLPKSISLLRLWPNAISLLKPFPVSQSALKATSLTPPDNFVHISLSVLTTMADTKILQSRSQVSDLGPPKYITQCLGWSRASTLVCWSESHGNVRWWENTLWKDSTFRRKTAAKHSLVVLRQFAIAPGQMKPGVTCCYTSWHSTAPLTALWYIQGDFPRNPLPFITSWRERLCRISVVW